MFFDGRQVFLMLQELPVGIQDFESLRQRGYLYVDKTARLLELVGRGERYFLSRPRRFGKSLTLSTLGAMFSGKVDLFRGLAAEEWVAERARDPVPVLMLDMAGYPSGDVENFSNGLCMDLLVFARKRGLPVLRGESEGLLGALKDVLEGLYEQRGPVAVLIDEYDKPVLDNIGNIKMAEEMRGVLRSFYTVLKSCDRYSRFVMLTGISKFSKMGVFSAMNNLNDISMDGQYGDIVGYTQKELEENFSGWMDRAAEVMGLARGELLSRMERYYDGFCFDGRTRLYNPFSILQCFAKGRISNYWYESGSPLFIVSYMKEHRIDEPERYRGFEVFDGFTSSQEIEHAKPESFLYQAGYLTIKKWEEHCLTLDYPNREVLDSLSRMYLEHIYHVEGYMSLGTNIWRSLSDGDVEEVVRLYNVALSSIPGQDFTNANESLYRSLFLMLLRGAGITAHGEVPTNLGRSDVLALFPGRVVVLEFKLARKKSEIDRLREEGLRQIEEKGYAKPYTGTLMGTGDVEQRVVTSAVIVIDGERREAVL